MKTEPTATPFAIPTWSTNGRTAPHRDGMTLCEMIHTDASITALLCHSEVLISFDVKEEDWSGQIQRDHKCKNCKACCKEMLARNVPFREQDVIIVLVCLRVSHNKPNKFKFVCFGGLQHHKAWRLQNDKFRTHATDIALRCPQCLHPLPPFPNQPAGLEERKLAFLWLRDCRALIRHWFVDDFCHFNIRCDSDHSAEVAGLEEGGESRPQGVSAIMVSIAKRFKLAVGLKEGDNLAALENLSDNLLGPACRLQKTKPS